MATLELVEYDHLAIKWRVSELAYLNKTYDKFVFYIWQIVNGEYFLVQEDTCYPDSDWNSYAFTYRYYTAELGNNILSPGCSYATTVTCYHGGTPYTLNYCFFSTPKISPVSQTFTPSAYAPIRDQGNSPNCVAQVMAAIMDTFKLQKTNEAFAQYSAAYIFGSDGRSNLEGMYLYEAPSLCVTYGSPRYELAEGFLPNGRNEHLTKENSISLFNNADNIMRENAKRQRFKSYMNMDFYDCDGISGCLEQGGCFMFNLRVPRNFYEDLWYSDGIVSQPEGDYVGNHSLAIIGSIIKNDKLHWITQGSWGEDWGDNGICYIPYDWGCGVAPPRGATATIDNTASLGSGLPDIDATGADASSWTMESYAIYPGTGYTDDNPSAPYNITARQVGREKKVQVEWGSDVDADEYIVLASTTSSISRILYKKGSTTSMNLEIDVDKYTYYYINVLSIKNGYCSKLSENIRVQLDERTLPARDWSWSDIQQGGAVEDIKYTRWNSFRTRISNWLYYKCMEGDAPDTIKYGDVQTLSSLLSNAALTSRNKTLTANKFNIAKYVIEQMNPTKPVSFADRSPGDKVYAYYFHELADALNSIPE